MTKQQRILAKYVQADNGKAAAFEALASLQSRLAEAVGKLDWFATSDAGNDPMIRKVKSLMKQIDRKLS